MQVIHAILIIFFHSDFYLGMYFFSNEFFFVCTYYFRREHTNTELYQSFLAGFDQFPWKTSNQLSAPMIPAIKDIKNLKSAHLIGKPEFGAVIESDVNKYIFPLPSNMCIEKCFI